MNKIKYYIIEIENKLDDCQIIGASYTKNVALDMLEMYKKDNVNSIIKLCEVIE